MHYNIPYLFKMIIAEKLVENKLGNGFDMLTYSPQLLSQNVEVAEIIVHVYIALLLKKDNILLSPLHCLAFSPETMIVSTL